jgi:hypothetical protein
MNKHTPEPWNYNDDMQFSKLHEGAIILKREDAIRAFKCVNACAGIEDPSAGVVPRAELDNATEMAFRYKQQRDELMALLEAFTGFTDDATVGDPWIESVRNAIAKVKGGQP